MKINDSEIIESFLKGNRDVFNIIIETHTKFVYNICLSLLKNIHDSEDVTQEVFILIFNNLNKFNNSSSLKTWIYKITYNQCLKFLKKRKPGTFLIVMAKPLMHPLLSLQTPERGVAIS